MLTAMREGRDVVLEFVTKVRPWPRRARRMRSVSLKKNGAATQQPKRVPAHPWKRRIGLLGLPQMTPSSSSSCRYDPVIVVSRGVYHRLEHREVSFFMPSLHPPSLMGTRASVLFYSCFPEGAVQPSWVVRTAAFSVAVIDYTIAPYVTCGRRSMPNARVAFIRLLSASLIRQSALLRGSRSTSSLSRSASSSRRPMGEPRHRHDADVAARRPLTAPTLNSQCVALATPAKLQELELRTVLVALCWSTSTASATQSSATL